MGIFGGHAMATQENGKKGIKSPWLLTTFFFEKCAKLE